MSIYSTSVSAGCQSNVPQNTEHVQSLPSPKIPCDAQEGKPGCACDSSGIMWNGPDIIVNGETVARTGDNLNIILNRLFQKAYGV